MSWACGPIPLPLPGLASVVTCGWLEARVAASRVADVLGAGGQEGAWEAGRAGERRTPARIGG